MKTIFALIVGVLLGITYAGFKHSINNQEAELEFVNEIYRTIGEVEVRTHQMGYTLYSDNYMADLNMDEEGNEYFYAYITYCRPLEFMDDCRKEYYKQRVYLGE